MKEHLFEFRDKFYGPTTYNIGDMLWSTVRPKVINGVEHFVFRLEKWNPHFSAAHEFYKKVLNNDWNGEFEVPCSAVRFNEDLEEELRHVHESIVDGWKSAYQEKQTNG